MRLLAQQVPDRNERPNQRRRLERLARRPSRSDSPTHLQTGDIQQSQALFQPRYDSIVYAPGRSEAHVAQLARVCQGGSPLDPLKIAAFGKEWFLVDGHHRFQAYEKVVWAKPVPVEVLQSDLLGAARVDWAIQESAYDNKKNRLSMSDTDKMDAAWVSVAREDDLSVRLTAEHYGIGQRSVGNMRAIAAALREGPLPLTQIHSWSRAKSEAKRLVEGPDEDGRDFDHEAKRRRLAARNLKGAMQMNLPPRLLAEVLESFSPGIVEAMNFALTIERGDDGGEDM